MARGAVKSRKRGCTSTVVALAIVILACGAAAVAAAVALGFGQSLATLGPPAPGLDVPTQVSLALYLLMNAPKLERAAGDPARTFDLVVSEGENAQQVIDQLVDAGIVDEGALLRRYLQYRGMDTGIQAGRYQLNGGMSVRELAEALQLAQAPVALLTIREGWRREQIAQQIDALALSYGGQAFLDATIDPPASFQYANELLEQPTLEGFLFPDTYQADPEASAEELVEAILTNFESRLDSSLLEGFSAQGLNLREAVTMASIVEREAVVSDERPLIAAVFLSRMDLGMPLESDPTVQFALGMQPDGSWWKSPLSAADLEIESPYNSYRYGGLPPGPIANPGLDSLRSVAQPADTTYLYFRAACDGSGRHLFAETFEEHLGNACPSGD